jgi:hypothetical protein
MAAQAHLGKAWFQIKFNLKETGANKSKQN